MTPRHPEARRIAAELGLEPHPEGGWFKRTWTAPDASPGRRGSGSSIVYLLADGVASQWHRIDASELWHHAAGSTITLSRRYKDGAVRSDRLGPDVLHGDLPQVGVEPGVWQSAHCSGPWALAVCVVVPEFTHDGFEIDTDAPTGTTARNVRGDPG